MHHVGIAVPSSHQPLRVLFLTETTVNESLTTIPVSLRRTRNSLLLSPFFGDHGGDTEDEGTTFLSVRDSASIVNQRSLLNEDYSIDIKVDGTFTVDR